MIGQTVDERLMLVPYSKWVTCSNPSVYVCVFFSLNSPFAAAALASLITPNWPSVWMLVWTVSDFQYMWWSDLWPPLSPQGRDPSPTVLTLKQRVDDEGVHVVSVWGKIEVKALLWVDARWER